MALSRRAALALLACLCLSPVAWSNEPPALFYAVAGDTQKPDEDPFAAFAWAVDQVNTVDPDFVLMPGDLTNTGTDNQYAHFTAVARRLQGPLFACVGNHDAVPGPLEYAGRFTRYTGCAPWYHRKVGGWHLIVLDSARFAEGKLQHNGVVSAEQLEWLRGELRGIGAGEPILLTAHHPFAVPQDGLTNAEDVLSLFEGRYLAYTVAGHLHYNRHDTDRRGLHHFVTGALSFSTRPAECGIGYRLVSTVGRDLWTAWVETGDEPPLTAWLDTSEPGALPQTRRLALPPRPAVGSRVALRVRYSGAGLTLRAATRVVLTLPATAEPATALVPLSHHQSALLLQAREPRLIVEGGSETLVERLVVYTTSADWEHYLLRAP